AGPLPRDVGTVRVRLAAGGSKVYYIVADFEGDQQVHRFAFTGNETVADALSQAGLPKLSAGWRVWVLRENEKLAVDWQEISSRKNAKTNYLLLPRDRVYMTRPPVTPTSGTPIERDPAGAVADPFFINSREFAIPFSVNDSAFKPGATFTL